MKPAHGRGDSKGEDVQLQPKATAILIYGCSYCGEKNMYHSCVKNEFNEFYKSEYYADLLPIFGL